jgi:hypothetical protein
MVTAIVRVEKEADSTVLADLEEIEFASCTIGPEDESTAVAINNPHLYLKGKVAEATCIRGAGNEKMCT